MKKRYAVLGMSMVLALALAVPALGGPSNPIAEGAASAKKTAKKALKKAKKANRNAKQAQNSADAAQASADNAQASADNAQATADAAAADAAVNTASKLALQRVFGPGSGNNSTDDKSAFASCPTGKDLVGGFGYTSGAIGDVALTGLLAIYESTAALASEVNATASNWELTAISHCINE